jgi:hypothetical protein
LQEIAMRDFSRASRFFRSAAACGADPETALDWSAWADAKGSPGVFCHCFAL